MYEANPFILSVSKSGIKTMPAIEAFMKPHPGDWVDFSALAGVYPFLERQYGRIERVDERPGSERWCSLVVGTGSAFMRDDGSLSISGGPFATVMGHWLKQTYAVKDSPFWNWGDHLPGAHQGVTFKIPRPVWKLTKFMAYEDWNEDMKKSQAFARWGTTED